MCVYVGKSIDIFEDVWNMWMRCTGVSQYIHADVLSFRCFAFSCGKDIERWFSPAQTIDKALEELCINLGIEKMSSIISASKWSTQISELKWPVFLTNIYLEEKEASVRENFYKGIDSHFVLFRSDNENQMICATSGIPYMEILKKQIEEKLSESDGFVVAMNIMPLQLQISSAGEILHRGMQWRRSIVCNEDSLVQLCPERFEKIQNRKMQLSVQYGLMNYQIQLSKVVRFCVQELKISKFITEKLNHILLKIPQVCRNCTYEEIVQIENDFWTLIEKIEEKY